MKLTADTSLSLRFKIATIGGVTYAVLNEWESGATLTHVGPRTGISTNSYCALESEYCRYDGLSERLVHPNDLRRQLVELLTALVTMGTRYRINTAVVTAMLWLDRAYTRNDENTVSRKGVKPILSTWHEDALAVTVIGRKKNTMNGIA